MEKKLKLYFVQNQLELISQVENKLVSRGIRNVDEETNEMIFAMKT